MTRTSLTSRFIPAAAAVALLVGLGCADHTAELAEVDREPVTVHVTEVESLAASRVVDVRGVVRPARSAAISSRVTGPVTGVQASAGDRVAAGAALLHIQPEAIEGQVAQAEGALAQARAALALAERNYSRYQALHTDGAASDLELDMARMEYEQARGAVRQAEGATQSAASVADEAVVRAPFDARVVERLVEVGDLATPGRPLVQVESLSGREIWLTVRESDIGLVEPSGRVPVRIDARPELGVLEGTVAEIVPAADPGTHTFTVRVDLGDVDLPTGLSGRAELRGEEILRLAVPAAAVHRRGGLELVVVRADDGTARTRAVTTGRALEGGRVEILSGLEAGLTVAIDAPGPVADGTPLEVSS